MNEIEKMCREHFNEPVLLGFELGRLIGFAEDDHDYYLIIRYPKYPDGRLSYHTAVGGYIFLDRLKFQNCVVSTGEEVWSDYTRMDSLLTLNGAPKEPEFLVRVLLPSSSYPPKKKKVSRKCQRNSCTQN
jgi:hypothetical protein